MIVWMSTKLTELPIKIVNTHIKYQNMKWAVVIKLFWIKYVQKKYCEHKNVHNVLGMLLNTSIK